MIGHDAEGHLSRIAAPPPRDSDIWAARCRDLHPRFADRLKRPIRNSELLVFEGCSHAPIYEKVEEFNRQTLAFLKRSCRS